MEIFVCLIAAKAQALPALRPQSCQAHSAAWNAVAIRGKDTRRVVHCKASLSPALQRVRWCPESRIEATSLRAHYTTAAAAAGRGSTETPCTLKCDSSLLSSTWITVRGCLRCMLHTRCITGTAAKLLQLQQEAHVGSLRSTLDFAAGSHCCL